MQAKLTTHSTTSEQRRRFSWETVVGILFGAFVFAGLALTSSLFHKSHNATPHNTAILHFEPTMFDFGDAAQDQVIHKEFQLHNDGTNTVRIMGIRSSCHCTLVRPEVIGKWIPPKSFLAVPAEFDTRSSEGEEVATIEVFLESDRIRYYAEAHIKGRVNPDFTVQPRAIELGCVIPGTKVTKEIRLIPNNLSALAISDVRVPIGYTATLLTNQISTNSSKATESEIIVSFTAPPVKRSTVFDGALYVPPCANFGNSIECNGHTRNRDNTPHHCAAT
jgi:hypothetical protein